MTDTSGTKTVSINVGLLLDNVIYEVPLTRQYTGKQGKSGAME